MLEQPDDLELRATRDHFGFQLLEPVEKDWHVVQARYDNFTAAMVYGRQVSFDEALQTTVDLVAAAWPGAL